MPDRKASHSRTDADQDQPDTLHPHLRRQMRDFGVKTACLGWTSRSQRIVFLSPMFTVVLRAFFAACSATGNRRSRYARQCIRAISSVPRKVSLAEAAQRRKTCQPRKTGIPVCRFRSTRSASPILKPLAIKTSVSLRRIRIFSVEESDR
ncbi:hypothetical protein HN011_007977 [Eciton burchellii]|nr:hypothetical protein HN011_007977 [Eciton burchellii]